VINQIPVPIEKAQGEPSWGEILKRLCGDFSSWVVGDFASVFSE